MKFYQIIWFLTGRSISVQQMRGGRLLKFGPFGNLASSQRLSSSLFLRPVDFHLFQRQKDEAFWGKWTAFGTYHDDRKRLDLHYCWSFLKGRGTKIKLFFLASSEGNQHISALLPRFFASNQREAFEAYITFHFLFHLHKKVLPVFSRLISSSFLSSSSSHMFYFWMPQCSSVARGIGHEFPSVPLVLSPLAW